MNADRQRFADFINRLIATKMQIADWQEYAVNHFGDDLLEDVRRCAVRLLIQHCDATGHLKTGHESEALKQLAGLKARLLKTQ